MVSPFKVLPLTDTLASAALPEGYRLCKLTWRKTEKSAKAYPNVGVVVPRLSLLISEPECLEAALRDALDGMQDAVIRAIVKRSLDDDTLNGRLDAIVILPEEVQAEGIARAMEEAKSGRLTNALIKDWFGSNARRIILKMAQAKSPDASMESLAKVAAKYEELFCKLASPAGIPVPVLESMSNILAQIEEPDGMDERIAGAIIRRMPKPEDEIVNLL